MGAVDTIDPDEMVARVERACEVLKMYGADAGARDLRAVARVLRAQAAPRPARVVIHRGPIPDTDHGRMWFEGADGRWYGLAGGSGPNNARPGEEYVVLDSAGREVAAGMFQLDDVRAWAAARQAEHDGGAVRAPQAETGGTGDGDSTGGSR